MCWTTLCCTKRINFSELPCSISHYTTLPYTTLHYTTLDLVRTPFLKVLPCLPSSFIWSQTSGTLWPTLCSALRRFKYPPYWVPMAKLWESMAVSDAATGCPRGYFVVRASWMKTDMLCYAMRCAWLQLCRMFACYVACDVYVVRASSILDYTWINNIYL